MTATEKQEQMFSELTEVLKKYNCSIALEDFGKGYQRDDKIVIDFDYDLEAGGIIEQLVLGSYIDGTSYL